MKGMGEVKSRGKDEVEERRTAQIKQGRGGVEKDKGRNEGGEGGKR